MSANVENIHVMLGLLKVVENRRSIFSFEFSGSGDQGTS